MGTLLEEAEKRAKARRSSPPNSDYAEKARAAAAKQQEQEIENVIGEVSTRLEEAMLGGRNFITVATIGKMSMRNPSPWWLEYCHFHEVRRFIDEHPVAKAVCDFLEEAERQRFVFSLHLEPLPDDIDDSPNQGAVVVHAAWR